MHDLGPGSLPTSLILRQGLLGQAALCHYRDHLPLVEPLQPPNQHPPNQRTCRYGGMPHRGRGIQPSARVLTSHPSSGRSYGDRRPFWFAGVLSGVSLPVGRFIIGSIRFDQHEAPPSIGCAANYFLWVGCGYRPFGALIDGSMLISAGLLSGCGVDLGELVSGASPVDLGGTLAQSEDAVRACSSSCAASAVFVRSSRHHRRSPASGSPER